LWIVGKVEDGQAVILHYDGSHFQSERSGTNQSLLTVWGARPDLIFAAGNQGTMLSYDGKNWGPVAGIATKEKITGLFGTSDRDIWAVGHGGVALHYDGKTWTPLPTQTKRHLNSGFSASTNDVWIVGDQGLILHYDGSRFAARDSGLQSDLDA